MEARSASTAGLSTLVQTVGYLIAAIAPLAIGAVHDVSGSWTPALIVLLALLVPQTLLGLRPRAQPDGHAGPVPRYFATRPSQRR